MDTNDFREWPNRYLSLNPILGRRWLLCRFYFIGDDDLLEILGQASNPAVIQAHLKKLFAGIHSVSLADGVVSHMNSMDQEAVRLKDPVIVGDVIEVWLNQLCTGMKETLQQALSNGMASSDPKRFVTVPSQVRFSEAFFKVK